MPKSRLTTCRPGVCRCGCGGKTAVATRSRKSAGWVKGRPLPYIKDHWKIQRRGRSRVVWIDGKKYRTIPLTRGKSAVVDSSVFHRLSAYFWSAQRSSNTWYAMRNAYGKDGGHISILLHREVMKARSGQEVDHRNGNGLDNRRSNLRFANRSMAMANRRKAHQRTKYSRFKGVFRTSVGTFWVRVGKSGAKYYLGTFTDEKAAAMAYDAAARKLFGRFACLNFPRSREVGCLRGSR